jgi:hypothetical protein
MQSGGPVSLAERLVELIERILGVFAGFASRPTFFVVSEIWQGQCGCEVMHRQRGYCWGNSCACRAAFDFKFKSTY